jgi:hypothetical protein
MSLVINIAHNVSLLLEGWTLTLALFVLVGAIVLLVVILRGRRKAAVSIALGVALSLSVLIPNSLLATPRTWQAMVAAYVDAPPGRSAEFSRDIQRHWSRGARGVLVRDWYFMARRWGVCHELWRESDCVQSSAGREAMGIARELLSDVAAADSVAPQ